MKNGARYALDKYRLLTASSATPVLEKLKFKACAEQAMICAACEARKHYECIDCKNNHSTYLCSCDCHDENTKPHDTVE